MANYTTEIRSICESLSGLTESVGYDNVDKVIESAIPKIFDFNYPIYDEAYRNVLNTKILMHYYTREIGLETVGLWKLKLKTRLNEIMPYYNKMYQSATIDFNPIYDTDLTTTYNKSGKGDKAIVNTENEELTRKQDSTLNTEQTSNTNDTIKTNDTSEGNITNTENQTTVYAGAGKTNDKVTKNSTKTYNEKEDTTNTTTTDTTETIKNTRTETPNITTKETPEQYTVTQNTTDTKTGVKKTITDNVLWDTPQDNINWFLTEAPTTISGSAPVVEEDASKNVANFMTQAIKNGESTNVNDTDTGTGTTVYSGAISTTETGTKTISDDGSNVTDGEVEDVTSAELHGGETIDGIDNRVVDTTDNSTNNVKTDGTTHNTQTSSGSSTKDGTAEATKNETQHITDNYQRNSNKNADEKYTDTTDYIEHITGKRGNVSFSKLIMEYREALINIDMMIIDELEDLFFLLW